MPKKLDIQNDDPQAIERKKAQRDARQAKKQLKAALLDLTDNWAGLNANQQREAMRTMLIVLAKMQAPLQ